MPPGNEKLTFINTHSPAHSIENTENSCEVLALFQETINNCLVLTALSYSHNITVQNTHLYLCRLCCYIVTFQNLRSYVGHGKEREKKMLVSTAQQPREVENATTIERELKKKNRLQ